MSQHKHAQVLRWIADGFPVQAGADGHWDDKNDSQILALVAFPSKNLEWQFRIHPDHQPEPLRFLAPFQETQA